ncbi:hypothetical protein, partial [Ameyamaea chiangmaiensis]|uniref:hypothetical protein n=1 Tax=Ameyamaea chiangmaiensis TaxID=442969 RepID=UPI00222E756D
VLPTYQHIVALRLQCLCGLFFECPPPLPQPSAEHASTDPDGLLTLQARDHLFESDVLLRFDHANNKGFMPVQPRTAGLALAARRPFAAFTFAPKPPDRRGNPDPE